MSSPVTASSRSSSGSTPAPTVNTPASQPSQPVSLPENNELAQAISRNFKSSCGIAPSVAICPSRFKWREHKHGRDGWSSLLSLDINAASGILQLRYSRPYLSVFRYACCALIYFNLQLTWQSFSCLFSSRHILRQLAYSDWGLLWWRDQN